jgi:hypothetical protein
MSIFTLLAILSTGIVVLIVFCAIIETIKDPSIWKKGDGGDGFPDC